MPVKKAVCSAAVPVLTIANPVVTSTSVTTKDTEPVSVTSSLSTPSTQSQPAVITNLASPVTTTVTQSSNLSNEKKEEVQTTGLPKTSLPAHGYQSSVRAIVTAVVTPMPSTIQAKSSVNTASTSPSVLMTPEIPVKYTSANNPPVSLPAPLTSKSSNIPFTKEAHMFTSSITPATTTWASSKISTNRMTDAHAHVSTIQTSSISNPVFTTKTDSRSSKVPHVVKSSSAFSQQSAFPLTSYEASVLSSAHNKGAVPNTSGGTIADLLQNPQFLQQQHKDYLVAAVSGPLQERMQSPVVRAPTPLASSIPPEIAARLGNPTSPRTPTPPVTSANLSSEIHNSLHLRHPSQSTLIVPPISLHPPDLNAYVHSHLNYAGSIHEIRAAFNHFSNPIHAQEAQNRAVIGMGPRYAYSIPPNAVPTNSFGQPTDHLQPSVMDAVKSDKLINDLSKVHESRGSDEKSLHSVKPGRSKKEDKEIKVIHTERGDHESRHVPAHEKIPSTSAITPHSLRQPQHVAHFPSTIRQVSARLAVSPHDRSSESPNPYVSGQSRVSQISIPGQFDEFKGNAAESVKPLPAHQAPPSTIPYHHSLGVLQIGSPAPGHIDGRSSNPAHSPSSHIFKKDSSHSQQMSLHNPVTDKRVNSEHSKKVVHARTLGHQGSSTPGPPGIAPAHSPSLAWHMQPHNAPHSSIPQSHVILPTNEQSSRRVNTHIPSQIGSEVSVHVPPPAHAMSQPSNVPRTLPQAPHHASQVSGHDAYITQHYPVMWQGLLALKNDHAAVQMHFVSGNPNVARASLPPIVDGETMPVRISQRMRLDQIQLEGVSRKIQLMEEHCILMALPCGKDRNDCNQQITNLKVFIRYLLDKNAAGIVNAAAPGSQQPAFVIHIFPACDFIRSNLSRIAPNLLHIVHDISYLVIIIATV